MLKAFEIAGYGAEVLEERFGGMYRAFQCGAPPHGGIAPGVDRIVMLLAGEENLREVVLFPMNQRAEDLMMGAPVARDAEAIARALHPGRRAGEVRRGAVPRGRADSFRVPSAKCVFSMPCGVFCFRPSGRKERDQR